MVNNEVFWEDEPEIVRTPIIPKTGLGILALINVYLLGLFGIGLLAIIIWEISSPICAGLWIFITLLSLGLGLVRNRQAKAQLRNVEEIQKRAQEVTGAEIIGSAIHVAGHPSLHRDQRVVLALKDNQLFIHGYEKQTPINVIQLRHIQSIHTIVYDQDRIPHMDVIDNTAQALQLSYQQDGDTWTCLFRRMRKVRPIDWYHALEQARFQEVDRLP